MHPSHDRSGCRTVFTFTYLREAARHALRQGESQIDGSLYSHMAAILCTAFFLEAYLNHIGAERMSDWMAAHDTKQPKDKLRTVAADLGVKIDYNSDRDYRAFTDAFNVRKALVHGRTVELTGSWAAGRKGVGAGTLETDWERICTTEHATRITQSARKCGDRLLIHRFQIGLS